jgi:diguanylate cyclase (GGDEF)-like protein
VTLDARALVLFATLMGLVLAAALYLLSKGLPESVRGVRTWALGFALQAGGALLVGLRTIYPDVALIPLGNTLIVAGHIAQFVAVKQFLGEPVQRLPLWLLGAAVFFTTLFFTYANNSFPARTVIITIGSIIPLVATARALFRGASRDLVAARYTAILLLGMAGMLGFRGAYTVASGTTLNTLFAGDLFQFAYVSAYVILGVLTGLAFVLLVAERLRLELERMATLDPLTGIYNRRTFTDLVERELARAARAGSSVGLVVIDLDHFKTVNDRYGHLAGDAVLRAFVATANGALRKQDLLGRYGGEEFCVVLPGATPAEAVMIAQRLRESVESSPVAIVDRSIHYTISAGVAHSNRAGLDLDSLVRDADEALYRAKRRGRNQVSLAGAADAPSDIATVAASGAA